MTSSLAKVNKSSGVHFLPLFLTFPNFLMFLNIRIDLLILKTYYGQFTLTTKKSLHIIFNERHQPPAPFYHQFTRIGQFLLHFIRPAVAEENFGREMAQVSQTT